MINFKKGDIVWLIDSTIYIKEVEIINIKYDVATVRFKDSSAGLRVRLSRLYKTKEEAEKIVNNNKIKKI